MSLEKIKKMYQRPARKAWAAETGQVLHYAIAKDRISSMALREKPDLGKEKLTWLQQHDQDCGSLYGVLPLCLGMPVAAADHLDRSRGILRGCAGEIVGWVWPMPSEGPVKKRRRFGTSCPRVSWSGSRPRPPGVSRRLMKTRFSRRAAKETAVFGQGAKAASTPCHTEAVSMAPGFAPRARSPRANLQRRRCHGHAHWRSRRPIDSLHC